ncbi:MAG: Zinc import ATP-binding protein ZnuC [Tenericutes bacterium ADurb.Bin024]|nr:MAG: Zinc import ATP-binding protein ZnuC [Tenericutes bacterium ADurb.Bin024]HOH94605.1 metal ABC transporter ATP-binding protein [Bacilli bacterium]
MPTSSRKMSQTSNKPLAVKLTDVSVNFGDVIALKNINFSINKGMLLYVIGPNGSGKTTFIRLLAKLLEQTHGTIEHSDDRLGYLPQKLNINPNFPITVEEVIYSGLAKQSLLISKGDRELIKSWLKRMQIPHLLKKPMAHLSGGQQQRVYIIRALISNPDFIILDEPTSALDPSFRSFFNDIITALHHEGKTIIFVTHELHGALCDCASVLYIDQEIRFFGGLQEYFEKEKNIHV